MNEHARVSVIIPVFDAGALLAEALGSVFSEQGAVGEVIVVDDGSTDDIERVLAPFRSRIRLLVQANRGPAAARNAGVALAREQYVAFLDADDVWPEAALSLALRRVTESSGLAGVHGLTQLLVKRDDAAADSGVGSIWVLAGRPWRSPQVGSVLVKRQVFEQVGGFDDALRQGEDLDWFVRLRDAAVPIAPFDQVMVLYRIHGRNMSSGSDPADRNTFLVLKRALDRRREVPWWR